jgi:energy-coupling factor transporter ATP-binding protein EcfA2
VSHTQGVSSSQSTGDPRSQEGTEVSADAREPTLVPKVFVFFTKADADWAEGFLIDGLLGAGAEVITQEDFTPGEPRLDELERAVRHSDFTVLVLSESFGADALAGFVERLAASYSSEAATWPVIPIVRDGVELPARLRMLTKLDASDSTLLARVTKAIRVPPPPASQRPNCPYPGMRTFGQSESKQFFGRRRETAAMVDQLNTNRFLSVIGPSGCGKSSLVFAGLLPALAASPRFTSGLDVRSMRPGADPVRSLHEVIGTRSGEILLVVDQLEELFTTADSESSIAFQRELLALGHDVFVVLTVRADFYEDLMVAPLWGRIKGTRFEVMALQGAALREAIEEPANGVGVYIESALVERLVNDAEDEPGTLPLVQETLVALWDRLERRWLPLAAYEAFVLPATRERTTGIQVAMAQRADASFGELGTVEQSVAHRQFIRLVNFGEGRRDTRRQQSVDALRSADEDRAVFDRTLAHFVDRRLLTQTADESSAIVKVDLAH